LLRTLTFALSVGLAAGSALAVTPLSLGAQDAGEGVTEYAPGSTGRITAPLATIVDTAKQQGEALRQTLRPLDEAEGAFSNVDFDGLRTRALSDPRVRALLGADATGGAASDAEEVRYDGATIFLLASFSMPKESLQQMMAEARKFGLPIVFRGFVNNSVYPGLFIQIDGGRLRAPESAVESSCYTKIRQQLRTHAWVKRYGRSRPDSTALFRSKLAPSA
jgi:conjugal transfer pilus assembly protein TrbC